jgi:hypothetical protein
MVERKGMKIELSGLTECMCIERGFEQGQYGGEQHGRTGGERENETDPAEECSWMQAEEKRKERKEKEWVERDLCGRWRTRVGPARGEKDEPCKRRASERANVTTELVY